MASPTLTVQPPGIKVGEFTSDIFDVSESEFEYEDYEDEEETQVTHEPDLPDTEFTEVHDQESSDPKQQRISVELPNEGEHGGNQDGVTVGALELHMEGESEFDPGKPEHLEQYYPRKSEQLHRAESGNAILIAFASQTQVQRSYADIYAESKSALELYANERGWSTAQFQLKTQVTVFESLALSSMLEELYLQMESLGHAFPGPYLEFEETDFLTYDERFALEVKPADLVYMPKLKYFKNPFIIDESEAGTSEERMAFKLQKDRAFIQEIIRQAKVEMEEHRTFENLKDNVSREDGRKHEEITLFEREKKAKRNVHYLRQRIVDFRDQVMKDEHNRKEMINHLKDQLFQAKLHAKMDARYTKATLEARNTFNFSEMTHESELSKLKTKELEIQMTRDRLAFRNIQAWSKLMCAEIQVKIKDWEEKLDRDLEDIDKKITDKQNVLRTQVTKIEELKKTIEERQEELGPWEEEKEKERLEKIEYLRLYYSARKIQRWWRDFMVKHGLYKKKKGKKGKGKSKGKGKRKGGKKRK